MILGALLGWGLDAGMEGRVAERERKGGLVGVLYVPVHTFEET